MRASVSVEAEHALAAAHNRIRVTAAVAPAGSLPARPAIT